jgi:hypothetical protein
MSKSFNKPRSQNLSFGDICNSFPNVELSYETIAHKKVCDADFCLLIPEGTKSFVWFTSINADNVCILMEVGDNKKITNVRIVTAAFDRSMAYGTIFYGTCFLHGKCMAFSIEDILYYKGKNISTIGFIKKLEIYKDIFSNDINSMVYTSKQLLIGAPIISTDYEWICKSVNAPPYKVKYIQFRHVKKQNGNHAFNLDYSRRNDTQHTLQSHKKNNYVESGKSQRVMPVVKPCRTTYNNTRHDRNSPKQCVLRIHADIQRDVYYLYVRSGDDYLQYGEAGIPNLKTSVFMNKLFRVIKENDNLDALEESDDEEEFEDGRDDKFVHLDKKLNIMCEFNARFKKWVPISIAQNTERVISKNDIYRLEKNN